MIRISELQKALKVQPHQVVSDPFARAFSPMSEASVKMKPQIQALIDDMIGRKIQRKTVRIKDMSKFGNFIKDIRPALDAKLIMVKHNPIDASEIWISLGPNAKVYEGVNGPAYRGKKGYDDASDSYIDEENEKLHFNSGLSGEEDTDAELNFNQHHHSSMYGDKMGSAAEQETYDWDDINIKVPGVQSHKLKDIINRGYEPVRRKQFATMDTNFKDFYLDDLEIVDDEPIQNKFNEGFTKWDMGHLVGSDLKDRKAIQSFVELHNINKAVVDIWDYMLKNYDRYPNKIVPPMGIEYGAGGGRKVEIEFLKDGKLFLWLFPVSLDRSKPARPIMSGKFTYKLLKDMMNY